MNERKQHVIKMAHKLFIDKGFQATSIQDILDLSGISKGTFYNYFSSKNELLIALFRTLYKNIRREMNDLLIGQDPSNIDIFMKQIEFQIEMNMANKLGTLFEEVLASNDAELKQFFKNGHLKILQWVYERFIDLFGESKKPYLLDCAIMFMGILNQNYKFYTLEHPSDTSIHQVVRYSVDRIVKIVEEVSKSADQLVEPEFLDRWLPDRKNSTIAIKKEFYNKVCAIKNSIPATKDNSKYIELLDFIQDELPHARNPRKHIIQSVLLSLRKDQAFMDERKIQELEKLVGDYFSQKEVHD